MIVGWTGHRPDVFKEPESARRHVELMSEQIVGLSDEVQFVCGGQRGVDMWAAAAARTRRIRLHIVLPVPVQAFTADWLPSERRELNEVMASAASIEIVDDKGII